MPFEIKAMKRRMTYFRAFVSFYLVAVAQLLSPAAAADPASKIDPPTWSHRHSQEEVRAYQGRVNVQEPEKRNTSQSVMQARQRRMLMQPQVRKF